jgi:hypothetical protein
MGVTAYGRMGVMAYRRGRQAVGGVTDRTYATYRTYETEPS